MASFLGRETLMSSSLKRAKMNAKKRVMQNYKPTQQDSDSEESSSDDDPPPKRKKVPEKETSSESSSDSDSESVMNEESSIAGEKDRSSSEKENREHENQDPSAKRKKKREASSDPNSDDDSDEESSMADENDRGGKWNKDDMTQLTDKVLKAIPSNDMMTYQKRLERINWDQIKFNSYTAEDCKTQWTTMFNKVRLYRTMTELATDVATLLKKSAQPLEFIGKNGKLAHPDMPKKPVSPFFVYCSEKRQIYMKKYPDIKVKEMTKFLAKRYQQLSEEKKKKYTDRWTRETEEYKVAFEKFKASHPEFYEKLEDPIESKRPQSAINIYVNKRVEEEMTKYPEASRKELNIHYRQKWSEMKSERREKYIKKAIDDKRQKGQSFAEYCKAHPEYNAPAAVKGRFSFSKTEKTFMDKSLGKPVKPPQNSFGVYTTTVQNNDIYNGMTMKDRLQLISKDWKAMSAEDKKYYIEIWEEKQRQYREELEEWKASLPEDKRKEFEAEEAEKQSKKPAKKLPANQTTIQQTLTQKPISAMSLYIEHKKEEYRNRNPNMSDSEVSKALVAKYQALSEEKKQKYKVMEAEEIKLQKKKVKQQNGVTQAAESSPVRAKATDSTANRTPAKPRATPKTPKKKHFPGAPKKPPGSGYSLFSTENLSQLKEVPPSKRLAVISQEWRAMSQEDKEEYGRTKDDMVVKYKKDVEKFKKTLSPEELEKYEEFLGPVSVKKQKKPVKKPVKNEPKEPEKPEENHAKSSSSDSDSDSGGGSGSGSDSGSGSGSGGGSGSDSDSSSSSGGSSSSSSSSGSDSDSESEDEAQTGTQPVTSTQSEVMQFVPLTQADNNSQKETSSSSSSSDSSSGSEDDNTDSDSGDEHKKTGPILNTSTLSSSGSDSDSD